MIGYHVPTRRVVSRTDLGPGQFVQALAADNMGRYLYAGIVYNGDTDQPNLFRWDLADTSQPAHAIGRAEQLDVRALAVAPDGKVYAVGMQTRPGLWEYDPATGQVVRIATPDPGATQARGVAATADTVFYASGSNLSGGDGASRAGLYAIDRQTHTVASILPPELAMDPSARDVAIFGEYIFVGTEGADQPAKVAAIRLDDYRSYRAAVTAGKSAKCYVRIGDDVYFMAEVLQKFSLVTGELKTLPVGEGIGEVWGMAQVGNALVIVSAAGHVAEYDLATGKVTAQDLVAAGAPADAQLGMAVAAAGGHAYVAGNGAIAHHNLATGAVTNLAAPGEAKDMEIIGGVLHTGQYNSQGIWRFSPSSGQPPHQAVRLPVAQNRPQDVHWDAATGLLLVGVQCDTLGGGSFVTYRLTTGEVKVHVNPFDEYQMVKCVTAQDGVAYLGGENRYEPGPRGELAAWDPVAGRELWRFDPQLGDGVTSLVALGWRLYGITVRGKFFVVDLRNRTVIHTANLRALAPDRTTLVLSRGRIYGASSKSLFRVDPRSYEAAAVVPDLAAEWYSGARLAVDENNDLYTLRGRNLIRVRDLA
ncbi:hypothetical protein [Streptomyces sp. NPDC056817]|uniref:hypothetical protein n=1 Tax=Streptomyces sp. NPDC056817 TaxID=3345950 RepID=UPI0036971CFD